MDPFLLGTDFFKFFKLVLIGFKCQVPQFWWRFQCISLPYLLREL